MRARTRRNLTHAAHRVFLGCPELLGVIFQSWLCSSNSFKYSAHRIIWCRQGSEKVSYKPIVILTGEFQYKKVHFRTITTVILSDCHTIQCQACQSYLLLSKALWSTLQVYIHRYAVKCVQLRSVAWRSRHLSCLWRVPEKARLSLLCGFNFGRKGRRE